MAAERASWKASQPEIDIHRLVFIDETGASTKMEDGAALWPFTLRPALCRSDPTRPLEDDDLRRRAQGDRHDCQWSSTVP